jgi:hypothetical protein
MQADCKQTPCKLQGGFTQGLPPISPQAVAAGFWGGHKNSCTLQCLSLHKIPPGSTRLQEVSILCHNSWFHPARSFFKGTTTSRRDEQIFSIKLLGFLKLLFKSISKSQKAYLHITFHVFWAGFHHVEPLHKDTRLELLWAFQKNTGTELAKHTACDQIIAEHTYKRKLGSHFRKETSLIPAGMVSRVFAKKPGQFPTQLPHCEKKF